MGDKVRFYFPEPTDREGAEEDICLAIFTAECLHGRPKTRLEVSYLVGADGRRCVVDVAGPAGETALRVFTGLCAARFGDDGFRIEHLTAVTC